MRNTIWILVFGSLIGRMPSVLSAQTVHETTQGSIARLISSIEQEKDDQLRMDLYLQLLDSCFYRAHDIGIFRGEEAISLARELKDTLALYEVLNMVGMMKLMEEDYPGSRDCHTEAIRIADDRQDTKGLVEQMGKLARAHTHMDELDTSLGLLEEAIDIAKADDNYERVAHLLLDEGYVIGKKGDVMGSMEKSTEAMSILLEHGGSTHEVANCLGNIASGYLDLGQDSMALLYSDSAITYLLEHNDHTNVALNYADIGMIHRKNGRLEESKESLEKALEANKWGDASTCAYIKMELAETYLLMEDLFTADSLFEAAVMDARIGRSRDREAAALISRAQFLFHTGRTEEATDLLDSAEILLEPLNDVMLDLRYLISRARLDSSLGHWKAAYSNLNRYFSVKSQTDNDEYTRRVMQLTMKHEFDSKEAVLRIERERESLRQRIIRNAIGLALLGTMIFLGVVYRQRNRIDKEKKRSESLLLNILPAEIAEELKEKGEASARDFDMVSILFTDFKGFTQASEKLSAAHLVEEINTCFKAFDDIVGKYGIEKIKTIGDAYMCAGGLPVPDENAAKNTVLAGLEMQAFMKARKTERDAAGLPAFEMRVGIHTGPVVAGIVGVKKFSYDIWGDTVNTASRMESSGEVGQVNISEATYELVKDNPEFDFTSRGKVQAKGKGELDMYFVKSK